MGEQIYFEDINVAEELPTVPRPAVRLYDIVRYSGAIDDYTEFHFDEAVAKNLGFPGMLVPGPQLGMYLMTAVTNWAGEWGTLKAMSYRSVAMTHPGEAANFKGKVTRKYVKEGENYVELDVHLENQRGEATNTGTAVVTLPSRLSK